VGEVLSPIPRAVPPGVERIDGVEGVEQALLELGHRGVVNLGETHTDVFSDVDHQLALATGIDHEREAARPGLARRRHQGHRVDQLVE
jgi:hypothetical protein